jgi:hypothetical protein
MKEGAQETMSGPSGTMAASMTALALMAYLAGQIWKRDISIQKIPTNRQIPEGKKRMITSVFGEAHR